MKAICILIISTLIASSVLFAEEVATDCIWAQSSQSREAQNGNVIDGDQDKEEEKEATVREG